MYYANKVYDFLYTLDSSYLLKLYQISLNSLNTTTSKLALTLA